MYAVHLTKCSTTNFEMWGHYSRIMHCIHSWIMVSHFIPEILHLFCSQYPSCCNNHPHLPTLHSLLLLHPLHHSWFSLPLSPPLPFPILSIHSSHFPFSPPLHPSPFSLPSPYPSLHSLPPPFPPSSCSHAYSLPFHPPSLFNTPLFSGSSGFGSCRRKNAVLDHIPTICTTSCDIERSLLRC